MYLLLKNSDALIFEWFAKFDELGTFRIDCQWRNDHVSPFIYYLANKTGPFFPSSDYIDETWKIENEKKKK